MEKAALETLVRVTVRSNPEIRQFLSARALALLDEQPAESPAGADVFEPLYRDAVARMIKREMNDLRGAVRRSLAKGQTEEFERWCDKFYGSDHPVFAQNLFQPVVDAQKRSGKNVQGALQRYLSGYMAVRRADIAGEPAEELENSIETWLLEAPNQVYDEVILAIAE